MREDRFSAEWRRVTLAFGLMAQFLQTSSAILQILTSIGLILAIISVVTKNWTLFAVAILFTLGIGSSMLLLYRNIMDLTSPATDWYWLEVTYTYRIGPNEIDCEQEVEIVLQALRSGVDRFINKYLWTGSGEVRTETLTKGHGLVGEPQYWEGWFYYEVLLGRHLTAGQQERVVIRQAMKDTGKKAEQSLSKTVTEPIGHLTLRVVPPRPVERVILHEYYSYFLMNPIQSQEIPFDKTKGEIVWKIDKPKLHHKYSIRWEY